MKLSFEFAPNRFKFFLKPESPNDKKDLALLYKQFKSLKLEKLRLDDTQLCCLTYEMNIANRILEGCYSRLNEVDRKNAKKHLDQFDSESKSYSTSFQKPKSQPEEEKGDVNFYFNVNPHTGMLSDEKGHPVFFSENNVAQAPMNQAELDFKFFMSARPSMSESRLFNAVQSGHLVEVKKFLDEGVSPNFRVYNGLYPLYCSIVKGHLEIAQALISKGAHVHLEYPPGYTILALASEMNNIEAISLLLKHGADQFKNIVPLPNQLPCLVIDRVMLQRKASLFQMLLTHSDNIDQFTVEGYPLLLRAISHAGIEEIQQVIKKGGEVNTPAIGESHLVALTDEEVQLLTDEGQFKLYPLELAIFQEIDHKLEVIELLVKEGARLRPSSKPNYVEYLLKTTAVEFDYIDLAFFILDLPTEQLTHRKHLQFLDKFDFSDKKKFKKHKIQFDRFFKNQTSFILQINLLIDLCHQLGQTLAPNQYLAQIIATHLERLKIIRDAYEAVDTEKLSWVRFINSFQEHDESLTVIRASLKSIEADLDLKNRQEDLDFNLLIKQVRELLALLSYKTHELEDKQWVVFHEVYVKEDDLQVKLDELLVKLESSIKNQSDRWADEELLFQGIGQLDESVIKQKFSIDLLKITYEKLKGHRDTIDGLILQADNIMDFAQSSNQRFEKRQERQKLERKKSEKEEKSKALVLDHPKQSIVKREKEPLKVVKKPIVSKAPTPSFKGTFLEPFFFFESKRKIILDNVFEHLCAFSDIPDAYHYGKLLHLVRIFEGLKKYLIRNESSQVIELAQVSEIRNMLVHQGAGYLDIETVQASTLPLKVEIASILLSLKKPHLKISDLSDAQQATCSALVGVFKAKGLDEAQIPLLQKLRDFHDKISISQLSSRSIHQAICDYRSKIEKLCALIRMNDGGLDLKNPLFAELLMIVAICGECYFLMSDHVSDSLASFLRTCHQIRNQVAHAFELPHGAEVLAAVERHFILKISMEEDEKISSHLQCK